MSGLYYVGLHSLSAYLVRTSTRKHVHLLQTLPLCLWRVSHGFALSSVPVSHPLNLPVFLSPACAAGKVSVDCLILYIHSRYLQDSTILF